MDNAVIIGNGVVGHATAEAFGIKKYFDLKGSNVTLAEAAQCNYIFICLPTPTINGQCFTDDIHELIGKISSYKTNNFRSIVVRSTVPPGFNCIVSRTYGIDNVISNPEFLSEATAIEDAKNPKLIVIGSERVEYSQALAGIYKGRFKYKEPIITNSITAEFIKYTINVFYATKVIFANEIYDYALKTGANYEVVKKVLEHIPWGTKNHLTPWYKGKRGIHGSCLPKDTEAFATMTDSDLFKTILKINERIMYAERSEQ